MAEDVEAAHAFRQGHSRTVERQVEHLVEPAALAEPEELLIGVAIEEGHPGACSVIRAV